MSLAGWLVMLVSVGGVTALFLWCLCRVLFGPKAPDPKQLHSSLDTPPDQGDRRD